MISGLKPTELLFRDGTSRSDRLNAALDPAFIPVDERTTADLVRFAQEFAQRLKFFNNDNRPDGTWEGFLVDDLQVYKALSGDPGKQKERREKWISGLVAYIANPEEADSVARNRYGKPHLSLFVTFLQLLGVIREQMNGFSERHLHFYYHEVLGLENKKPIPDMAYVLIDLAEDVNSFVLKSGTAFTAGKDAAGKPMVYRAVQDTFMNKAKVAEVKNVFVDRTTIGNIREAWKSSRDDADGGLLKMMRMAFGYPNPGDPMVPLRNPYPQRAWKGDPNDLPELRKGFENPSTPEEQLPPNRNYYIRKQLMLGLDDFRFITALVPSSPPEDWAKACDLLEKAYRDRTCMLRQEELRAFYDPKARKKDDDFLSLWEHALGDPNHGGIPPYGSEPFGMATLNLLQKQLKDANKSFGEARVYVRKTLLMTEEQFLQVMDFAATYPKNPQKDDLKYEEDIRPFYAVFEDAQTARRNFVYGSPSRQIYYGISAFKEARDHLFCLPGEEGSGMRFRTFGKPAKELKDSAFIGFALSSPQLDLAEGTRTVSLEVEFGHLFSPFTAAELNKLVSQLHFYISSGENWLTAEPQTNPKPGFSNINGNLGMTFKLVFAAADPPLCAPTIESELLHGSINHTVLAVLIDTASGGSELAYKRLLDLEVSRIRAVVRVENLSAIVLQNDDSEIDPRKPFEPFGFRPHVGSGFYIAHPEACAKKLDSLQLNLEWMNAPDDFKTYYEYLLKVVTTNPDRVNDIWTNTTLQAKLQLREDGRSWNVNGNLQLFNTDKASGTRQIDQSFADVPAGINRHIGSAEGRNSVLDWKRYFVLEMSGPDYPQDIYLQALNVQAGYRYKLSTPVEQGNATDAAYRVVIQKLLDPISPPYLPKLKSIGLGYTCSFTIDTQEENDPDVALYHIHPFGGETLDVSGTEENPASVRLLPDYGSEGELYIGFDQLQTLTQLSLFFKMAEGSADPDTEVPEVTWTYLSGNTWKHFPAGSFISDLTGGLQHSGIITLSLPEDASDNSSLMPGKRYWIRAAVKNNSTAISDTVNIYAQAVSVVFEDRQNDPSHYDQPLPAGTIAGTLEKLPEVAKVEQPYTSYKGRSAESPAHFRNRVSERLRHKNRAVTMWDYESLVLEHFPEIHKVKCMPAGFSGNNARQGGVDVIVIPDIRGKLPFNPYQPKASTATLLRIREFLGQRMPVFADVSVRNATFMQVKARFAVRFRETGNERFLLNRLDSELRRYLAPWAFEEGADIVIGGRIYASMIVNFIAGRPYVEFVTSVRLFQKLNGESQFTECIPAPGKESRVEPGQPDIVLVSAPSHEIDLIGSEVPAESDLHGIDYMKVELDFRVGS